MAAWLARFNRRLMARTDAGWRPEYVQSAYQPDQLAFYRERLAHAGVSLEGKAILDVGCGPGQWLRVCADSKPACLIGSDYSRSILQAAKDAGGPAFGIRLLCSDALAIPLQDGYFDLVISSLLLPYVPSDRGLIRELARVCAPDGRLLLSFHGLGLYLHYVFSAHRLKYLAVPPASWISFLTGKKLLWNTYQSLPRVTRLLNRHGFEVEQVHRDWSYLGFPYIVYIVARKIAQVKGP